MRVFIIWGTFIHSFVRNITMCGYILENVYKWRLDQEDLDWISNFVTFYVLEPWVWSVKFLNLGFLSYKIWKEIHIFIIHGTQKCTVFHWFKSWWCLNDRKNIIYGLYFQGINTSAYQAKGKKNPTHKTQAIWKYLHSLLPHWHTGRKPLI